MLNYLIRKFNKPIEIEIGEFTIKHYGKEAVEIQEQLDSLLVAAKLKSVKTDIFREHDGFENNVSIRIDFNKSNTLNFSGTLSGYQLMFKIDDDGNLKYIDLWSNEKLKYYEPKNEKKRNVHVIQKMMQLL